jgi:hypoxanthine phosphoribosyltransferase
MRIFLDVIGVIGAIAGIISLYIIWPRIKTWRSVVKGVKDIVTLLKKDKFSPDLVVSLGRGGAIFGGLVAGNLGAIPILGINRAIIADGNRKKIEIIYAESLQAVQGKKVLLVTGEIVTATDITTARESVCKFNPEELRTATYTVCKSAAEYPNYFAKETASPTNAPWRILPQYGRPNKPGMQ